jgi:TIR domain
MAHDVFISHSTKDKPMADAVCATFEANGIRCWIAPRDVPPGANWGAALVDAIQASRVMVLIFSDHANASSQIAREVELAAGHGVTIVPIRVKDVMPASSLQFFLSNIHWLDALTPPLERRLQEIAAKIKVILQQEGTLSSPHPPVAEPVRQSSRKIPLLISGAVLALVVAIGFLVWRPWRSATPDIAAKPAAQGPGDPALIGRWAYLTTFLDQEIHFEFTLDAAGRYTFRRFLEADGTVEAKDGSAKVIDSRKKQFPIKATYVFPSDDRLNWSVPFVSAIPDFRTTINYKRSGGARVSENPLVGKWKGTTLLYNLTWDAVWDVLPDSSYHVLFDNVDEGFFTAGAGKWEAKSSLGRPPGNGMYRNVTPDSFEMSDPLFQFLKFERVTTGGSK